MKIIISPAKKMNPIPDFDVKQLPDFIEQSKKLQSYLQNLDYESAKKLWQCSDRVAVKAYEEIQSMHLENNLSTALLTYDGIQYQYMRPDVLNQEGWEYLESHLRILSAFYGVLKPLDGVVSYRLEMQAKIQMEGVKDLYDFWGKKLYESLDLENDDNILLNLASKEYSQAIRPYILPKDRWIDIEFLAYNAKNQLVTKATWSKMARGAMVRFLAENKIQTLEEITRFNELSYRYLKEASKENHLVFVREPEA